MSCNKCRNFHIISNVTDNGTNLILTVTNSNNIANKQRFCLCINRCISQSVVGAPKPVLINIDGANVSVIDKFAQPLTSDVLAKYHRQKICGYYVSVGNSKYVIFNEIPVCGCNG